MSLSRKLIERLVNEEVQANSSLKSSQKEVITKLAQQIFLIQITQSDTREQRKSIQDKIEHFHSIMTDGDIK
ncbi:hypothetical protein [Photobacterium sanguinicancri]|uniref:hypothetical protein n=1 Tax=Photobacterium sanguinicancri TaxID=875932 RepID=UPI00247FE756|nr:hypothetical protein [Photobacterium sanguinicancri]